MHDHVSLAGRADAIRFHHRGQSTGAILLRLWVFFRGPITGRSRVHDSAGSRFVGLCGQITRAHCRLHVIPLDLDGCLQSSHFGVPCAWICRQCCGPELTTTTRKSTLFESDASDCLRPSQTPSEAGTSTKKGEHRFRVFARVWLTPTHQYHASRHLGSRSFYWPCETA